MPRARSGYRNISLPEGLAQGLDRMVADGFLGLRNTSEATAHFIREANQWYDETYLPQRAASLRLSSELNKDPAKAGKTRKSH